MGDNKVWFIVIIIVSGGGNIRYVWTNGYESGYIIDWMMPTWEVDKSHIDDHICHTRYCYTMSLISTFHFTNTHLTLPLTAFQIQRSDIYCWRYLWFHLMMAFRAVIAMSMYKRHKEKMPRDMYVCFIYKSDLPWELLQLWCSKFKILGVPVCSWVTLVVVNKDEWT